MQNESNFLLWNFFLRTFLRRVDKNEGWKITNEEWEILKKYKFNDDEIDTFKKYDFWFNARDFLVIGLNNDSTVSSQKLTIRIVILIALIEDYMRRKKGKKQKPYGASLVKDFFSQLNIDEKFALNWIIEVRNPTPVEIVNQLEQRPEEYHKWRGEEKNRIREYKRSLIEKLISNEEKFISDEFKNRIQYLYDLRSQTVHRGEIVHILEHRHPFLRRSEKWVILLPYKERKEEIILYFNEEEIDKPFEEILEDLFFISFFRNKKIFNENGFFENSFKKTFKRMLENIPKYNHDLLPLSLRKRLEFYAQNI
jgi:hypothetical protein